MCITTTKTQNKMSETKTIQTTTQANNTYSVSINKVLNLFRNGNKPNWYNMQMPLALYGVLQNKFGLKATSQKQMMKDILLKLNELLNNNDELTAKEINQEYIYTFGNVENVQPNTTALKIPALKTTEIKNIELSKESEKLFLDWFNNDELSSYTQQQRKQYIYNHIETNCKAYDIFKELKALKLKYGTN